MLSVSLLGGFRITDDETPVPGVDTPRLQSLLAYLLLHSEASQSRAHLAFLFWPESSEAQARANLRHVLYHLRRALPDADALLHADVLTLQWRPGAAFTLDVADFYAALAQAEKARRASDSAPAQEALERAIALYRGDLLPSCYDDWIIPHREELRQRYLAALERLVWMMEEQRDFQAAIVYARRLLRDDPLHEATYRRLIRLHDLNGNRAGALRVYHECATVLERELGVEPSRPTQEAYERLLDMEAWPPPILASPGRSPLVERDEEWRQLQWAWRLVAADGGSHLVLVRGEAGIGKTRLAEELLQWADRQGITTANACCYAAEGELAYAPVTAWLRAHPLPPLEDVWLAEVARLLPEVLGDRPDLPRLGPLTEAWQRQRLFEALSRSVLGGNQPLLLTIDDLQWCDRDTLHWLHFLLRFDPAARLLVIGTYRPEEVGDSHALMSLLQALRRDEQVTEFHLRPLSEGATQALAEGVAGRELDMETAQFLYRETEGNPLFVVETLRAGLPTGGPRLDAAAAQGSPHDYLSGDLALPRKVQLVLEARLAQVSSSARERAELAATIGREFSFQLLAQASDCDEDTLIHEIDELWKRGIVRERGTDAYDFSHDKLREVAYNCLSSGRRRLLHERVARALETLHARDTGPVSYQVATHYERAGLPGRAVPYYLRAAEVARQVYANEDAIGLLQRGLMLLEEDRARTGGGELACELAADLWERLGDVLELTARHAEALQAYQDAGADVRCIDRMRRARLNRKSGAVLCEQRRYVEALDACRRAEATLGRQPDEESSRWWEEWIEVQIQQVWVHYWLCQLPEMDELVKKVEPVVQARESAASRQRLLMVSCMMRLRRERYAVSDGMLANSRESLALSQGMDSPRIRVESEFELGFLHLWRHELNEAEEHLQAALELAESSGIVPMQVLSLTYLTVLYRFRDQLDAVLDYAARAQEGAEAAEMPDYVAAARGNQAWHAWRRGDLSAAEQLGQEAIALWEQTPLVYPFQWQALWPLIAVALARGREHEAWAHAQALLDPPQQRLPDELSGALEAAIQGRVAGDAAVARSHMNRALELAREMGYL